MALVLVLGLSVLGMAQTKTLTILHSNDTHSALLPFENPFFGGPFARRTQNPGQNIEEAARVQEGCGIARMSTLIKRLRAKDKNVLALHAGDVFVGSFEFNKYLGYPELKIMEDLYDAMALGNHEFDLGLDVLAGVVSGQLAQSTPVNMPLLCANMDFSGTLLAGLVKKSIIRTVGGIKVGIFGVVTEDPQNYSSEITSRFSGAVYTVAGRQAYALKMAGCQVVICLSHLGTMADLMGLADNVPGINIIIGGHSHDLFERAIVRGGKIIVQAGSHGKFLGELKVNVASDGTVRFVDWILHPVDNRVESDVTLQGRLNTPPQRYRPGSPVWPGLLPDRGHGRP